jgi:hypothetical protein
MPADTAPLWAPDKIEIAANGPVDGMGEKHPEGSYVQIMMQSDIWQHRFRISRGMAEGLVAELQAALGTPSEHHQRTLAASAAAWMAAREACVADAIICAKGVSGTEMRMAYVVAESLRALPPPSDAMAALAEVVRVAVEKEREAIAADTDCGCVGRDAVLARLESQGEKRASYLCSHGDLCGALQAAAIRARSTERGDHG